MPPSATRMLPTWSSGDGVPSPLAIGLLVLLGASLLIHPVVLWPHYRQTPYAMSDVERVTGEALPEDATIEYGALPAEAQRAFDDARRGESRTLWGGEDDRAIGALANRRYIRYDGEYYEYAFTHGDVLWFPVGLVRGLLTTVGALLLVMGGLLGYSGTWRPVTPVRSLWVPVGVTLGLVATQTYDLLYGGAGGSLPLPHGLLSLLPMTTLFLGVGSVYRSRGPAVVLSLAAMGTVLLLGGAVITDAPPVVPVVIGGVLVVGGAPWLVLGYVLSNPEKVRRSGR